MRTGRFLLLTLFLLQGMTGAFSQTVLNWQVHQGLNGGIFRPGPGDPSVRKILSQLYGEGAPQHGDPGGFEYARPIPGPFSRGWRPATVDPADGQLYWRLTPSVFSRTFEGLDFTYFQATVTVDDPEEPFVIRYDKVDDGVRVYVFNDRFPDGEYLRDNDGDGIPDGDARLYQPPKEVDIRPLLDEGNNRIVLVQFDDSATENYLKVVVRRGEECDNDTEPPVLAGCPERLTVTLDLCNRYELPLDSLGITATDNCTDDALIAFDLDQPILEGAGTTTVTVTATDAAGNTATCGISVTTETNPDFITVTAEDDALTTDPGQAVSFTGAQLLSNDAASDGSALELRDLALVNEAEGTLTDNGNGTFTFEPAVGFTGIVELTYSAVAPAAPEDITPDCTPDFSDQAVLRIEVLAPDCNIFLLPTVIPAACPGTPTGTIELQALGFEFGIEYQYSIDSVNFQSSGVFEDLLPAQYALYAREVRNFSCFARIILTLRADEDLEDPEIFVDLPFDPLTDEYTLIDTVNECNKYPINETILGVTVTDNCSADVTTDFLILDVETDQFVDQIMGPGEYIVLVEATDEFGNSPDLVWINVSLAPNPAAPDGDVEAPVIEQCLTTDEIYLVELDSLGNLIGGTEAILQDIVAMDNCTDTDDLLLMFTASDIFVEGDSLFISALARLVDEAGNESLDGCSVQLRAVAPEGGNAPGFAGEEVQEAALEAGVYPNPFQQEAKVTVVVDEDSPVTIEVRDMNGKLVESMRGEALQGVRNDFPIYRQGLQQGFYFITVRTASTQKTIRAVITR